MFKRGDRAGLGSYAGIFAFDDGSGEVHPNRSFRPVVLSSQL